MIGIINKELNAYSLISEITKEYPTINIYLIKDEINLDSSIALLRKKNCQIIIIPSHASTNFLNSYSDIFFLKLNDISLNNSFSLDDKELIEAIISGDELKVDNILKELIIPKDRTIIINNPTILFIIDKIQEIFPNEIKTSTLELLNSLSIIIEENNLEITGEGKVIELI